MISRSKLLTALCLVAVTAGMNGCGNGQTPVTGQSGRLVQGPVTGATIFADNVANGVRFTQDAGEVSTTTDAVTGDFTLPSVPSYNYILVSKGGTDKLTGQPAIQMIAPAGAANVTPLTTLVALDTTGSVKAQLQALMPAGFSFDSDISTTASPAVLLVTKSVETMVQSMTNSVTASATTAGQVISPAQVSDIQMRTMQAIATQFVGVSAANLATTATLSTTLGNAATTAATNIHTANPNITIPSNTASTIASSSVTATTTAFGIGANAATTAIVGGETAAITPAAAQTFVTAVNNATATAASTVTASTTPTVYTPPAITVVTPITVPGTTGATGGNTGGTGNSF